MPVTNFYFPLLPHHVDPFFSFFFFFFFPKKFIQNLFPKIPQIRLEESPAEPNSIAVQILYDLINTPLVGRF